MEEFESPEHIFSDYAYFSSYSDIWLQHAQACCDMAVARLGLDRRSQVVEIGSNDGYLLQYFVQKGVPVLGIEPAANVAAARDHATDGLCARLGWSLRGAYPSGKGVLVNLMETKRLSPPHFR